LPVFDPTDLSKLDGLQAADLVLLPQAEDDLYEYKSSLIKDAELAEKIGKAASAFWNSGGGFLVVGIDGKSCADGGVAESVGRQPRRDWVDQALAKVEPRGPYTVHQITGEVPKGQLTKGNVVLVVAFQESSDVPHMAPDRRYYIRAGALSVPASHFLVEALRARRASLGPSLSVGLEQSTTNLRVVNLVISNLSPAPAFNVMVKVEPPAPLFQRAFGDGGSTRRHILGNGSDRVPWTQYDQNARGWFEADVERTIRLAFQDSLGRHYSSEFRVTVAAELGKEAAVDRPEEYIARQLSELTISLKGLSAMGPLGRQR
jgi:hypothetical protein